MTFIRARQGTHSYTYVQKIHDALSRACVQERCVKWANLYLSDIEYSYRGAVGADKSVYTVRCVLTAPVIVPLGIWTTELLVCIWVGRSETTVDRA